MAASNKAFLTCSPTDCAMLDRWISLTETLEIVIYRLNESITKCKTGELRLNNISQKSQLENVSHSQLIVETKPFVNRLTYMAGVVSAVCSTTYCNLFYDVSASLHSTLAATCHPVNFSTWWVRKTIVLTSANILKLTYYQAHPKMKWFAVKCIITRAKLWAFK